MGITSETARTRTEAGSTTNVVKLITKKESAWPRKTACYTQRRIKDKENSRQTDHTPESGR